MLSSNQAVLGYRLKERIGAGGYGEVWSAEAPGGLLKAVKFVYGYHEESRAQRELKALNNIKQLRHPFLLSLERIEIVDDQLVIVTELAERSLKDRFSECVRENQRGIARDELLGYMRDAADALDYLSREHSLQHLDIKPENLLLVGGHIKVADFGLLKDLENCTQSMMGGLTPAFSAPELFDGRPSTKSDQYSLAIVYQEMLTGERPMTGTTAAQLAAQHMHGRPNLAPLPRRDQAVVAKALSKKPEHRYPTCTAFVEDLCARIPAAATQSQASLAAGVRPSAVGKEAETDSLSDSKLPAQREPAKVEKRPAVPWNPASARLQPTLFLGMGRTGTTILRCFKRRLSERLGDPASLAAFRILCLDTDIQDLRAARTGEPGETLSADEIVELPLRRPEDYRRRVNLNTTWLSRRWIYNVPRSLKTEGLRPLGRLAWVDHHEKVFERLHAAVSQMMASAALEATAGAVGLESDATPRVVLVGSVAGGLASGSALDVAYAVRSVLRQHNLCHDHIQGFFVHSCGRLPSDRRIAASNTYSFLRELKHYSSDAGFPGDPSCGLVSVGHGVPTFSEIYLVHLGENLGAEAHERALENLAEYLYLRAATSADAFWRDSPRPRNGTFELRSLGIARLELNLDQARQALGNDIYERLLKQWLNSDETANRSFAADRYVEETTTRLGFTTDRVVQTALESLQQTVGPDPAGQLCHAVLEAWGNALPASGSEDLPKFLETARRVVDREIANWTGDHGPSAFSELHAQTSLEACEQLHGALQQLVDRSDARLKGADQAARECRRHLQSLVDKIHCIRRRQDENLAVLQQEAMGEEVLHRYVQFRVTDLALAWAQRMVSAADGICERFQAELRPLRTSLKQLLSSRSEAAGGQGTTGRLDRSIRQHYLADVPRLAKLVEERLEASMYQENGGLSRLMGGEARLVNSLSHVIHSAVLCVLSEQLKSVDPDWVFQDAGLKDRQSATLIQECRREATPGLLDCGGAIGLLVAMPERSRSDILREVLHTQGEQATVVCATWGDVLLCYEMEQIPISNVALRLIEEAPESADLVRRLHTRIDVEWTPLTRIA
jgi:hypothetical protein